MTLHVDILNHASALLQFGHVTLLTDPWFEGTCFSGGWGLSYDNPDAYELAARATHLWVSHWHSDHLHADTLSRLSQQNPGIRVLANVSANFSMVERFRTLGFQNVVELGERLPLEIAPGVHVTRYPTGGIDNMLHLQGGGWSVLNYNDSNLPAAGVRALRRRIGRIDLLLSSYNHAGKLFRRHEPETERRQWYGKLASLGELFEAQRVIPFASSHYYRCSSTFDQNESLLSFDDLERLGAGQPALSVLRIGDQLVLSEPGARPVVERRAPALSPQPRSQLDYGESIPVDDLIAVCSERCGQLRRNFGELCRLVPPLRVWVGDLGQTLEVDLHRGTRPFAADASSAHIEAHSRALADWLGRRFGDDTFFAGAHFGTLDRDTSVIERWALVTLLEASHLDPRSVLAYLGTRRGLRFLWSRREEIVSTVASGRVRAAQLRL